MLKRKKGEGGPIKLTGGDRAFYAVNTILLALLAIIVIYPLYFIIIASFSDPDAVLGGQVILYPIKITFEGYAKILQRTDVWRGYLNTIIYTLLTVVLSLAVTIPGGWALSRKTIPGKKFLMIYFIIPMFFGGGLIPFYNVMSKLRLINTIWAIVLPSILSVWNLFMTRTFFESSIPDGLVEAAKIDGAGEFRIFTLLVIPLSKAILAVMALYYAIGQWNSYFNAMIFLQDEKKYPVREHHGRQRRDHSGAVPHGQPDQVRLRHRLQRSRHAALPLRAEVLCPGRHDRLAEGLMLRKYAFHRAATELF